MTDSLAGVLFVATLIAALIAVYRPLGDYIARTASSTRHLRVERVVYRVGGVDPESSQSWRSYLASALAFSALLCAATWIAFVRVRNRLSFWV